MAAAAAVHEGEPGVQRRPRGAEEHASHHCDARLGSAGSVYSALQRHICEALCGLSPHEKMDDGTALFVREGCSIVREAVVLTR